jgi:hypothetical protein
MAADQRGDVAEEGADESGEEDDHDQGRVDVDEEDVDADPLGVLQRHDEDKCRENAEGPPPPVDGFSLL